MSSLCDQTRKLPKDLFKQVEQVYGDHFPLEVRFELAHWIEREFAHPIEVKQEDIDSQKLAAQTAQQLLVQLDIKADSIPSDPDKFLQKQKLNEISNSLKTRYNGNPVGLYMKVHQCLQQELAINTQFSLGSNNPVEQSLEQQIRQKLSHLKPKVTETGSKLERCKHEQEAVTMEIYTFKENDAKYEQLKQQNGEAHAEVKKWKVSRDKMEVGIKQKFNRLSSLRTDLVRDLVSNFHEVKEVQAQVLDKELINWKREQQLAGNGLNMTLSLESLQEWCEGLANIIWTMRQQIKQLELLNAQIADPATEANLLPELLSGITDLLSNLVTGTFIIEKQPPQVMKTNTRFTATVRLLVGGQLNVHMASPSVSVSIISENQANQLLKTPAQSTKRREDYSSGEILNGQGNMEFHATTRQVSVTFRNLQLKRIKRTEKKGTESVMEEKFSVLFWTEFQIGELKFQVWTLSLPVVVIVHGNQEPQALATITWDNAFAEWGRPPFRVPDKVSWAKMASALNMKWTSACGTNRSLTEENLYYLACKVFRNPNLHPDDFKNLVISWGQFCREPLPDRNFTFWEWFYRVMNLTANHMRGPWSDGYIMAFVSKNRAEELLTACVGGTFLLRFSDSELGGVTIAYVRQDQRGAKSVFMVAPFTTKDLSQRSVADVIFDLQELTYLYPEIPKEHFRKFSASAAQNKESQTASGYVPHSLKIHAPVPNQEVPGELHYNPAMYPNSPYQGESWTPHDTSFGYSQDGEMGDDPSMASFDPSTININEILGIASSMYTGNQTGSMDIN